MRYLMPNFLYTYLIYMYKVNLALNIYHLVRLGLWHINHCWLSNVKSSLYIYIKYI